MTSVFLIWAGCFFLFFLLGIFCFWAKKPVSFFANVKQFPVTDVRGYNRACGKLWIFFSVLGTVCGLPMLRGQNDALILLSILGVFGAVLILILTYILFIEKKYRSK